MDLKFEAPVFVTKPYLPPIDTFKNGLNEIWENKVLTNKGPILKRFENKIKQYSKNKYISIFSNGTLALQIALQGLDLSGEVITTPFSFIATTHALYWNKLSPVFSDIEEDFFTLDPKKIEEKITPWTSAILAVHTFGHPCNLIELQKIADKHKLKLIYDAAHSFGVKISGDDLGVFGDVSMFSFHATKLFHTFEGGMLSFNNKNLKKKFGYLKNFGFKNELEVVMPGTNAKMNEIQALMGLQLLDHMGKIIRKRKNLYELYKIRLNDVHGITHPPELPRDVAYNYSYMPVRINTREFGISRDDLYNELKNFNVFSRKYFYPLIPDFSCYKSLQVTDELKTAKKVAGEILILPLYPDLKSDYVNRICDILKKTKG